MRKIICFSVCLLLVSGTSSITQEKLEIKHQDNNASKIYDSILVSYVENKVLDTIDLKLDSIINYQEELYNYKLKKIKEQKKNDKKKIIKIETENTLLKDNVSILKDSLENFVNTPEYVLDSICIKYKKNLFGKIKGCEEYHSFYILKDEK